MPPASAPFALQIWEIRQKRSMDWSTGFAISTGQNGTVTMPISQSKGPEFKKAEQRFYYVCIAPAMLVLGIIIVVPTLFLVAWSFTPLDLTRPETWWDFSDPFWNYELMTMDDRLINSFVVQSKLSFWSVIAQLVLGFSFALFLNRFSERYGYLRTVFLIPMVLPPIAVAIIWKIIYTPDISPVYWTLQSLGIDAPTLITHPDWALTAIIIADTWEWFPFTMLMILSALQMMPEEYSEAARIDGANGLQITWYVTLPYLKGILLVAGMFRLIDSLKAFPLIFVLTNGGPGSVTEVTNYYSFTQAFNFSYLGYSSAITMVLIGLSLILSWFIIRATGWNNEYQ